MVASSENDVHAADRFAKALEPAKDSGTAREAVQCQTSGAAVGTNQDSISISPAPPVSSPARRVEFVKGNNGQFDFVPGTRFINNIPLIVGFLELGNAADFAANVWNEIPVPLHAIILMAIGGTVAAMVSVAAFRDFRLARKNVCFLRQQRREQKAERARRLARDESTRSIDVYLAVTFRELGSEVITRLLVDLLLGFGGILISIGTYMAIGGANETVWTTSNILSGYLGNAPIAINGLISSFWAAYVFTEAQRNIRASQNVLKGSKAAALIKKRGRQVQVFCVINGTATIVGGGGSLLTATQWWAYIIITPVFIASIFCNIWWRRRIGYSRWQTRPEDFPSLVPSGLVAELEFAARARQIVQDHKASSLGQFVADPSSLADVLAFLQDCGLFDIFCVKVVSDKDLCDALGGSQSTELDIGANELLALPKPLHANLLEMAEACLRDSGAEHFTSRERYTAELLGTFYHIAGNVNFDGGEDEK